MVNHTTPIGLLEGIDDQQNKLTSIKRRLHLLKAFVTELTSVTKGKPFTIWDSLAWMMALDSRDALILHLASFAKGLHKHHLKHMLHPHLGRLKRVVTVEDEYDPLPKEIEEAFTRLFPDCVKKTPGKADVKALRCRLEARIDELRKDRNANRAHVFELGGNARMLSLEESEAVFDHLEGLLSDLRLIASQGNKDTNPIDRTIDPHLTARVLVDRIVLDMEIEERRERGGMYEQLHESHDANPHRQHFNAADDKGLISPGRDRRVRSNSSGAPV